MDPVTQCQREDAPVRKRLPSLAVNSKHRLSTAGARFSWLRSDCLNKWALSAGIECFSSIGEADLCPMLQLNVLTSKWWLRKHWDAQWQPISKCAKFFVKSFKDIYFWTGFRQIHLKINPFPSKKKQQQMKQSTQLYTNVLTFFCEKPKMLRAFEKSSHTVTVYQWRKP